MRWSRFVVICACAALVFVGHISMYAQKKKEPITWPADNIKWMEVKGAPGIMFASLWGNMGKGAYGALVKFPAGTKHPMHTHTSDIKAVVISGTFYYAPEGGTEQRLGPGSYFFVPGGTKHMSGSTDDGPCEIFQESPGKFDMMMVEEKK